MNDFRPVGDMRTAALVATLLDDLQAQEAEMAAIRKVSFAFATHYYAQSMFCVQEQTCRHMYTHA
jgi:hypothetical protein